MLDLQLQQSVLDLLVVYRDVLVCFALATLCSGGGAGVALVALALCPHGGLVAAVLELRLLRMNASNPSIR